MSKKEAIRAMLRKTAGLTKLALECPECGKKCDEGAEECPGCGKSLKEEMVAKEAADSTCPTCGTACPTCADKHSKEASEKLGGKEAVRAYLRKQASEARTMAGPTTKKDITAAQTNPGKKPGYKPKANLFQYLPFIGKQVGTPKTSPKLGQQTTAQDARKSLAAGGDLISSK